MMEPLRECPFCGGEAALGRLTSTIICLDCKLQVTGLGKSDIDTRRAWNCRVSHAPTEAPLIPYEFTKCSTCGSNENVYWTYLHGAICHKCIEKMRKVK